jgi:hypothetical protein
MSKNIILLSDGTGNSNVKNRGTNVYKLYEAIDFNSHDCQQVAFYDDGVGTQEFKPLKFIGGAFGWGLSRNIRNLYKQLVHVFEPGDKIYLFGFSRGAFTVRRLAGLIGEMGILDKNAYHDEQSLDSAVWHCFKNYRQTNRAFLESFYDPLIKLVFEDRLYKLPSNQLVMLPVKPDMEFIGVWDTVAAVGLPFDEATNFLDKFIFKFKFKDHTLNEKIKRACHALSVDDERQTFHPLLWINDKRVEQVWFPGVHSNVGGGYPQQGLSLVSLDWMMEQVKAKPEAKKYDPGLRFVKNDEAFIKDRKYAFDKLYDSRSGLGVYYRYKPRDITKLCADNGMTLPKLHVTVFERIAQGIFGYAPGNIPRDFEVVGMLGGKQKHSQQIADLVDTQFGGKTLLEQTAKYFLPRRILYYVFLIYSILIAWWLIRWDLAESTIEVFRRLKILVSPDGLLDKLITSFVEHPTYILLGVIVFSINVAVRRKMEDTFSEFWSKLRPQLRDMLVDEPTAKTSDKPKMTSVDNTGK